MKISEILSLLAICKNTYYELRRQGKLGPVLTVGRRGKRHRRIDVAAYVESQIAAQ